MNNTQEITIDNLAETLEYNGWDRKDSDYSYSYIFGLDNIYWDINGIIHVTRQKGIYIWVDNKLINIIVEHFKLKPLPKKTADLWDWCLANGWICKSNLMLINNGIRLERDNDHYLTIRKLTKLPTYSKEGVFVRVDIDFDLPLDNQINLLNAFMEAYNE